MGSKKIILEAAEGGLAGFLERTPMFEYCDSVVAIFDINGLSLYENASFKKLRSALDITVAHPDLEDAYILESLTADVITCASEADQLSVRATLYLSLNVSMQVTIKLIPVYEQGSDIVLAVMISIAEENLAFANYSYIQQQHENRELKSQIITLAKNLDEQGSLVKALLHETPFAIMLVDPQRKVVQINRACETLLGVTSREVIGHTCDAYLDCFQCHSGCPVAKSDKALTQQEGLAFCVDGEQKQVLRSTVKLGEDDDALILEAFIDITDRKLAEKELLMHRNNLEVLVQDRTKQLELARQESDRANKAKTEFLSRMSHELRTPLNAIIGFSHLLEMELPEDTDQHKNVSHISSAGEHLLMLISELLNLSKIESGGVDINYEHVSVSELVMESMHYIEEQANQRGITLNIDEAISDLTVYVDRLRYKEVLLNILSNAVKYNSENGEISAKIFSDSSHGVCFEITDTGPGIEPEKISQLCEPFTRLGAEHTDIEGSGVGLSIVKLLVALMDGELQIESTVGQGSTFRVCFPSVK